MSGSRRRRGNAVIEFTLVGIPTMLMLICIFEVSRGMWLYQTLGNCVREGTRTAIVRGYNCETGFNNCKLTIGQIALAMQEMGAGLDQGQLLITMQNMSAGGNTVISTAGDGERTLAAHLADATVWPAGVGSVMNNDIRIIAKYPFRTPLVFFWPGSAPSRFQGIFWLSADSRDKIQF
jgi:Flp pilus assembly protein TadG